MSGLDSFAPDAGPKLQARAVRARMGQLLAEEAGLDSAEARAEEAAAFTLALAVRSGRGYAELAREVKRRAAARVEALGGGSSGADADRAEEEVLARPELSIADLLTWREAEVLRRLAEAYNESASKPNVIPCVRADYLCALLRGTVPKTAVRAALRRLQELGLVYQRQFSTTVHYQPSDVAFEAVGVGRVRPRYHEQPKTTVADEIEYLFETAAYLTHEGEPAAARVEALLILTGADPAEVKRRVNAEVAKLVVRDREREARRDQERLQRAVIDARDQLLPRDLEVLEQIVADYNRSVRSYDAEREARGDELIPGANTFFRDTVIRPSVRTVELIHQLKGRLAKTAVKRALTRLRELDLVRYDLDVIMGAGYWTPTRKAFDSLAVERAEFTQYD